MRAVTQRYGTFAALRDRNFRWYWLGILASSATMQMVGVGQGWLVYEITGSALALGWVTSGWSITNALLSPFAGVLSDRVDKRTLLIWVWVLLGLTTLATALLIRLDLIAVWHLTGFALFRGALFAVLMPAQNAYLGQLVDSKTLLNAVALNSIGMGLAGIFSAPAAGWLIDTVGAGVVFVVITALYGVVLATVLPLPRSGTTDSGARSVAADLTDGLRYVRASSALIPLLAVVFLRGLLAMPYATLMPKYAEDVMGLDASGLGILVAAPGVGSLVSSLVMASMGDYQRKGRLMLASGVALGIALALFANTRVFILVLVVLAIVGAANNISMVTNQTLLQSAADGPYLGRVMSFVMMTFGIAQLGTIPVGSFADRFGVPQVLAVLGAALAGAIALIWALVPRVKKLT